MKNDTPPASPEPPQKPASDPIHVTKPDTVPVEVLVGEIEQLQVDSPKYESDNDAPTPQVAETSGSEEEFPLFEAGYQPRSQKERKQLIRAFDKKSKTRPSKGRAPGVLRSNKIEPKFKVSDRRRVKPVNGYRYAFTQVFAKSDEDGENQQPKVPLNLFEKAKAKIALEKYKQLRKAQGGSAAENSGKIIANRTEPAKSTDADVQSQFEQNTRNIVATVKSTKKVKANQHGGRQLATRCAVQANEMLAGLRYER